MITNRLRAQGPQCPDQALFSPSGLERLARAACADAKKHKTPRKPPLRGPGTKGHRGPPPFDFSFGAFCSLHPLSYSYTLMSDSRIIGDDKATSYQRFRVFDKHPDNICTP